VQGFDLLLVLEGRRSFLSHVMFPQAFQTRDGEKDFVLGRCSVSDMERISEAVFTHLPG
jgi:hypothetical protein